MLSSVLQASKLFGKIQFDHLVDKVANGGVVEFFELTEYRSYWMYVISYAFFLIEL